MKNLKQKIRIIVFWGVVFFFATCFAIFLFRRPLLHYLFVSMDSSGPPISIEQIQAAIQKSGGNEILQQEAAKAMLNYTNGDTMPIIDITNCPAIVNMASFVEGEVVDVTPDGAAGIGVPAHIELRRGSHFDYQFIYIFGTGMMPSKNNQKLKFISAGVYLRNTAP